MSRSRRKQKLPKCICGRHLVRTMDHAPRRWRGCPLLEMIEDHDRQFLKYLERRSIPLTEED